MAKERKDDGNAFIKDPGDGPIHAEGVGSEMVEEFMMAATSGEDMSEDIRNQVTDEEYGGPFIETKASDEIADDEDESNPPGATQEPLPSPDALAAASPSSRAMLAQCAGSSSAASLIEIPAGPVRLGAPDRMGPAESDERPRSVQLGAFAIDRTEVTRSDYAACVASGACGSKPGISVVDLVSTLPMTGVTWREADLYLPCARLALAERGRMGNARRVVPTVRVRSPGAKTPRASGPTGATTTARGRLPNNPRATPVSVWQLSVGGIGRGRARPGRQRLGVDRGLLRPARARNLRGCARQGRARLGASAQRARACGSCCSVLAYPRAANRVRVSRGLRRCRPRLSLRALTHIRFELPQPSATRNVKPPRLFPGCTVGDQPVRTSIWKLLMRRSQNAPMPASACHVPSAPTRRMSGMPDDVGQHSPTSCSPCTLMWSDPSADTTRSVRYAGHRRTVRAARRRGSCRRRVRDRDRPHPTGSRAARAPEAVRACGPARPRAATGGCRRRCGTGRCACRAAHRRARPSDRLCCEGRWTPRAPTRDARALCRTAFAAATSRGRAGCARRC